MIDCNVLNDGTPYIVMEHLRGRPLGRIIAEEEIPLRRALDIVSQILGALGVAHDNGVVHADVKSDNFLVDELERSDHVTMIDFGLARLDGDGEDNGLGSRVVSGTPEYMAPEVIGGATPSAASDLYAVGVILYELLTGTTPFAGGLPTEIMARHVDDVVIPPSLRQPDRDIPPALDQIVLRALAKRPAARFPDAGEFARALDSVSRVRSKSGRHSRFELDPVARPDSPTVNCTIPRQRFARGSKHPEGALGAEIEELRQAIVDALVRGQVQEIAESYVKLATTLARNHRFARAVAELEEGIDILTAGRGPSATEVPKSVDRLVVALAALYAEAGQRERARRIAASVDGHATFADARRLPR